jgi:hypothetical protein
MTFYGGGSDIFFCHLLSVDFEPPGVLVNEHRDSIAQKFVPGGQYVRQYGPFFAAQFLGKFAKWARNCNNIPGTILTG